MAEHAKYLLIGAFAAGHAAQTIREHDKKGRVVIVGQEPHPPYDRPPLSKDALYKDEFQPDDPYSKRDEFWPENNIEIRSGVRVEAIDKAKQRVELDNGTSIDYDKLLIATGATPRVPHIAGNDLWGVFYLRVIEDSQAIRLALKQAKSAVVIGASYMGLEVASGCLKHNLDVTIIDRNDRPWPKFASEQLGQFMREQYEEAGARFVFDDEMIEFSGNGSGSAHLAKVITKNNGEIAADVCIACTGVTLYTQLAADAGLKVSENGIEVNEFLQTSDPNIWAAGDITSFPDVTAGRQRHVEHYMNGKWQGQTAGANMAGAKQPYDKVAYFFSDFLDLHMILRGDSQGTVGSQVRGSFNACEFVELYHDQSGKLKMGVAISRDESTLDPISDKLEELIRAGKKVDEIKDEDLK